MAHRRADQIGEHRAAFDRNKKKIYATQSVCGICGQQVDFALRYPNPMSKTVDHIIPINRGGHPSDLANLQLAHLSCNRQKSDKLTEKQVFGTGTEVISNRMLPQTFDWKNL